MKKIVYILLLLVSIKDVLAQKKTLDTVQYAFVYELTYQVDSTDEFSTNAERMILSVGKSISKFESEGAYLRDSVRDHMSKSAQSINLMKALGDIPKTNFKEKILKNYPQKKISYKERIFREDYEYQEPMDGLAWKMTTKEADISGFHCKQAKLNYGGRVYTAWFTTEIPISDGPYKFYGLPGLIVQITDRKKHYDYLLVKALNRKGQPITVYDKNEVEVTKPEFYKIKKDFWDNPFKKLESAGISIDFGGDNQKNEAKNKLKKRNNPIELIYE